MSGFLLRLLLSLLLLPLLLLSLLLLSLLLLSLLLPLPFPPAGGVLSHPSSSSCSSSAFSSSASCVFPSLEVKDSKRPKEGKEREVKVRLSEEVPVVSRVSAPAVGMDVHVPASLRSTPQSLALSSLLSALPQSPLPGSSWLSGLLMAFLLQLLAFSALSFAPSSRHLMLT